MSQITLVFTVEPKDEETIEGVMPGEPTPERLAVAVQDRMADITKHDGLYGYRVLRVEARP
jgi:hypothetical protein